MTHIVVVNNKVPPHTVYVRVHLTTPTPKTHQCQAPCSVVAGAVFALRKQDSKMVITFLLCMPHVSCTSQCNDTSKEIMYER